jgi:hypothetical protein
LCPRVNEIVETGQALIFLFEETTFRDGSCLLRWGFELGANYLIEAIKPLLCEVFNS